MSTLPIGEHALLSDRHSAALVSTAGSVVWLSMPRFDSPAVFAGLLDEDAGHWTLRPAGDHRVERSYEPDSMVLRTVFHTGTGTLVLRDALCLGDVADPHRLGEGAPHLLLRSVACPSGRVRVQMRFSPRPEYGVVTPALRRIDGGVTATGGADRLTLSASVDLDLEGADAGAEFDLEAGQDATFSLQRAPLHLPTPPVVGRPEVLARLDTTTTSWQRWSAEHQAYQGRWCDLVHLSGRVLQALSYEPTGAIVAAASTSLPEQVGGERNWDYRYAWVRDASMTMQALWVAACPDEAHEFFDFIATAAAGSDTGRPLQVMFGVGGEHDLSERTLAHLSGWRGSSPVRVGNGAWSQAQLDVYGEILDAAQRLRDQLGGIDAHTRDFLVGLADQAAARWRDTDNGIWEVRGEPRHFVHSKVMCWVALDRALQLADWLDADSCVDGWRRTAEDIRSEVLTHGWNDDLGSFTQSFDSDHLDATALLLPIVGFLPADDVRVQSTIDRVRERLTDDRGLVHRYDAGSGVDGLEGGEGTFLLCTFWLAEALALSGRVDEGVEVFENAAAHANDLGLLAEEVDPATGELLGNFPQAFSHIGLVNAAWALHEAGATPD